MLFLVPALGAQERPNKIDFALLAADASVRTLDAYSTRRDKTGAQEMILPRAVVSSDARMYAFSAAMFGVDYLAWRQLRKHGHPKLARLPLLIDISSTGFFAVRNLTLPIIRNKIVLIKERP